MLCRVGAGGPGCEAVMFRCCSGTHPLKQRRPCWVFRWQTDLALNAVSARLTGGLTLLRCPCWHGGAAEAHSQGWWGWTGLAPRRHVGRAGPSRHPACL